MIWKPRERFTLLLNQVPSDLQACEKLRMTFGNGWRNYMRGGDQRDSVQTLLLSKVGSLK